MLVAEEAVEIRGPETAGSKAYVRSRGRYGTEPNEVP